MSEENKKQNPELNEQALEGVSGGYPGLSKDPWTRADQICGFCRRTGGGKCSKGRDDLANYMRGHGLIDGEWACPFRS